MRLAGLSPSLGIVVTPLLLAALGVTQPLVLTPRWNPTGTRCTLPGSCSSHFENQEFADADVRLKRALLART